MLSHLHAIVTELYIWWVVYNVVTSQLQMSSLCYTRVKRKEDLILHPWFKEMFKMKFFKSKYDNLRFYLDVSLCSFYLCFFISNGSLQDLVTRSFICHFRKAPCSLFFLLAEFWIENNIVLKIITESELIK